MSESTSSNKPPKRHPSDDDSLDSRESRKLKATDDELDAMDVDTTPPSSSQHLLEDAEIPEEFLTIVNAELPSAYSISTASKAVNIISMCMALDHDHILKQMFPADILELVIKNPKIMDICQAAAAKGDARDIFRLKSLRKEIKPPSPFGVFLKPELDDSSVIAAQSSWTGSYRGGAANALWSFLINQLRPLKKVMQASTDGKKPIAPERYANFAAIVQSSGMGKSRAVDELAKTHFVIPINIRTSSSSGFPPPDEDVRNFLCKTEGEQEGARNRSKAFLLALFEVTEHVLSGGTYEGAVQKFDYHSEDSAEVIAAKFRAYMAEKMEFRSHGPKRRLFFKTVVNMAEKHLTCLPNDPRSPPSIQRIRSDDPIDNAFVELVKAVQGKPNVDQSQSAGLIHANEGPQVVIMFDEAHTLTTREVDRPSGTVWSTFTELRRVLRNYSHVSLFVLFLSTTGKIDQFVSPRSMDLSLRIASAGYFVNRPYIDLGFDHLAIKLKFSENIELSDVVTDEHIAHYGRPLWGSIFDSRAQGVEKIQDDIITLAVMKLLGGVSYTPDLQLNTQQKLACLSQRLPIEFNSTNYVAQEQQLKQVEGHMRVCLKVDEGFESMATVSPSEPILSEAAYYIMQSSSNFNVASTLRDVLGGFSVHKGDRGELIVMLLFTLARDAAVDTPVRFSPKERWCTVPNLLSYLFLPKKEMVLQAKGQFVDPNPQDSVEISKELQSTFGDSKVYYSHIIKVHQFKCVGVDYLVRLFARGAAILCANNHAGIDGVIPVLLQGSLLTASNMAAILWQGKNNSTYGAAPDLDLFKAMDPYHTQVFDKECDIPVIRIVFALAAKKPSLKIVNISESKSGKRYKTYDIWAAGLSPEVFGAISAENVSIWDALLQASSGWQEMYSEASPEELMLRKMENPGAALEESYWNNWSDTPPKYFVN